jgi:hypothetical protein
MKHTFAAVLFVLAGGCRTTKPQPSTVEPAQRSATSRHNPTSQEECRACNGAWGRHGLVQTEGCNCRTKDAGKICRHGSECESVCVAKETPDQEVVDKGPPARGFFLGQCAEFVTPFGCARIIDKSGDAKAPVLLDEPPMKLCVD